MDIAALHARYVDAVNRQRADLVAELFTDDAFWDLGPFGEWHGPEQVRAGVEGLFAHWETIFHTIHSAIVDVADGGMTATGRLWFTEFGIRDGEPMAMAGCFHDRYARASGARWQFAARRHDLTWRYSGGIHQALAFPTGYDGWVR